MRNKESDEFVELLKTRSQTEIAVIKSILDSASIKYYFVGKPLGKIYPTLTKPARLMVEKRKIETARKLLKESRIKTKET
ncbi:MAG: DUF2007 domain-containing protein [candidate division WOR-3 bacterium]|nr:MAG: DUF2007 domain-containing protein [candidate division WOR-3 bacterium]